MALAAPAALFALIRGLPPRRALTVGWSFGIGLFGLGTYWLYTCLHVFGLVPAWLTLMLQTVLVLAMAGYLAGLCYLANRFWLKPNGTRDWLVLPALWVLLEWLRGWLLSGFPWLSTGYALIDSPLAGWAPLAGVYAITWAGATISVAVNVFFMPGAARARRAVALGVVIVLLAAPVLLRTHSWTRSAGAPIAIAAVQGAVPQDQKWQVKNRQMTLDRYWRLTDQAWGARIVIWPESSLPAIANNLQDYLAKLREQGRVHNTDLAIGLVNFDVNTAQYFNGLLVMPAAPQDRGGWYYKRHLVPFGEYFPVPATVRSWMRLMSLPNEDFTPGAARQPTLSAAGQKLGLTICYEDAFGSQQLSVLRDATLLINVTNNAWFGDSMAPHQHLQIARMRALETERYLVQASNDGVTAAVDARGRIIASLPQFVEGVMHADIEPRSGLTPYARFGNYPVILGALGFLATAVWRRRNAG